MITEEHQGDFKIQIRHNPGQHYFWDVWYKGKHLVSGANSTMAIARSNIFKQINDFKWRIR